MTEYTFALAENMGTVISIVGSVAAILAAIGAIFAAALSWSNRRHRLRGELPEIAFLDPGHGYHPDNQVMLRHFRVCVHHPNFGWRVSKVQVVEATNKNCLRHAETGTGEWRDYDEFDHPIEPGQDGELDVRPGTSYLVVKFLCIRPRKKWWWKGLTTEKSWVGPIPTHQLLYQA